MDTLHVGPYATREPLGGSRADVHRAVDTRTGRSVVVKRATWDQPQVTAALAREAAVLRRVHHPSLVQLVEVVEDLDGRALVLADAAEGDLTRLIARHGAMPPTDAADLGARLAGALAALHAARIVHRDVRPSNVVVDAELVPVLCDLDHALAPSQPTLATDTQLVGDPAHVDPAVHDGAPQGPALDLFGLGSTVWAAATGGAERPDDLRDATGTLPPRLLAAIAGCLDGTVGDASAAAALFAEAALAERAWRPVTAMPAGGVTRGRGAAASGDGRGRGATVGGGSSGQGAAGGGGQPTSGPDRASPRPLSPSVPLDSPTPSRTTVADDAGSTRRPVHASTHAAGTVEPPATRVGDPGRSHVRPGLGIGTGTASATQRWAAPGGNRHPSVPPTGESTPSRRRWIVLGVTVVLLVGVLAWVRPWPRGEDDPTQATGSTAGALPACEGVEPSTADDPTAVLADVGGEGCGRLLTLRDGVLTTPTASFAVGRDDDVLLAGDWDDDGRWSPAIHRPATGEVFLFDDAPAADGAWPSTRGPSVPADADVIVDRPADGPHVVVPAEDAEAV